jgi:hypothetical protein
MDQEPEPAYAWQGSPEWGFEIKIENEERYFRTWDDGPWLPLTDEVMKSWGYIQIETSESKIARLEWRVRQLELELQRRQDYEAEMQERN